MGVFSMKASSGAGTETPPAGLHPAVLVALVDLGSHFEEFKDDDKGTSRKALVRKLFLVWELTAEKCSGMDRNHVIGKEFNLSFSPKSNLRKMIEAWRGKAFGSDEEFDIGKLLGKPCMLNLSHKTSSRGNTYAQIASIAPPLKGTAVPKPGLTPIAYEVGTGEPPMQTWLPYVFHDGERVPVDTVIKCSQEWKQATAAPVPAAVAAATQADEEPF